MANKKYSRKTDEEKKQEIKNLSDKVLSQIKKYTTSPEDLLEYANYISQFYHYSPNNIGLIQDQFHGAVAVASFKDWKEKGYSVNKGEKGIKILSYTPVTLFEDENGEEKNLYNATEKEKELIKNGILKSWKVPRFKIGHVFDVSQTNCPLEDLPKAFPNKQFNFVIDEGSNVEYLKKGINAVAKELNIEIKDMRESRFGFNELGSAKGAFLQGINPMKKEIVLNSRNTETQAIATSIHELAHAKLHDSRLEESKYDSSTKEFQAELTSYIVCKHYGMDTSEKAIPYIAKWTANGDKIEDKQKALEGVHRTSREFIDIIDTFIAREQQLEIAKAEQSINYQSKGMEEKLFPIDKDETLYCDLTGKAIAQDEGYYHLENGMNLSEKAREIVYSDEEWNAIYTDEGDNYWTTCFYDVDESEMTSKEPEPLYKDVYYQYNGQSTPEKLGTISDIVTRAEKQEEIGHFVYFDTLKEFAKAKIEGKETFNNFMAKNNILENPGVRDFQMINERLGKDKNENLSSLDLEKHNQIRKAYLRQAIER